jgi:protein SCO1/2
MNNRRTLLMAALAMAVSACAPEKPSFKAIDLTGADYAQGFQLQDQFGQERTLADFKGQVVVVFFGYTQCPDFCPTTLSEWVQVKKALGENGKKLQAVFITVDPERDTPEVLKDYMANFDPSFLALIPTLETLPALAKNFKIYYKKVPGPTPTSYTMDHQAGTYMYDTEGRLRLYARYGLGPAAMAEDIGKLLK